MKSFLNQYFNSKEGLTYFELSLLMLITYFLTEVLVSNLGKFLGLPHY